MSLIHTNRCLCNSSFQIITRSFKTFVPLYKKGPELIHHKPPPAFDHDVIKKLKRPESISSTEDWMKVRYKNRNARERLIHAMATDDRLVTESKDAEEISDSKLRALETSLVARG